LGVTGSDSWIPLQGWPMSYKIQSKASHTSVSDTQLMSTGIRCTQNIAGFALHRFRLNQSSFCTCIIETRITAVINLMLIKMGTHVADSFV